MPEESGKGRDGEDLGIGRPVPDLTLMQNQGKKKANFPDPSLERRQTDGTYHRRESTKANLPRFLVLDHQLAKAPTAEFGTYGEYADFDR
jgi:hypothetical protein